MSGSVFPTLPGLAWNVGREPEFNTGVTRAVSGREVRLQYQAYPLWKFSLTFEVLRAATLGQELETLCGFFLVMGGQFDSFLYTDPADNTVTDQPFGSGTGSATAFQLVRAFGAGGFTFVEPVQNVNAITNVKVAGVLKNSPTDYTVNSTGLVTFTTPPASGAALTWSGSFYYRCRFLQDMASFNQFMKNLHELKKLEFVGSPGNKV